MSNELPPMMLMQTFELHGGRKYRMHVKIDGQKTAKEYVAVYLTETFGPGLLFSGRPEFGNVHIDKNWIKHIEEVPADTKCVAGRRIRK